MLIPIRYLMNERQVFDIITKRDLLLQLPSQNGDSATEALWKFRTLKRLREKVRQHPQAWSVTAGQQYTSLLEQSVIPAVQARRYDTATLFMQDGVPPHIARCVKHVLHCHFDDDKIISRHFPTV
ncbi:hypothetical protein TNCV_414821 [Trichonephila clavipes]|nr:hypothetical protein TNCV_414821 [Trichonephila clavipes]